MLFENRTAQNRLGARGHFSRPLHEPRRTPHCGPIGSGDHFARLFADRPATSFAIWSLWLSSLYFLLGPASYVRVIDAGNGTLPARMWMGQQLWHGGLGDWLPLACCGSDRVLNAYRLELPSLLFAILPGWLAYGRDHVLAALRGRIFFLSPSAR